LVQPTGWTENAITAAIGLAAIWIGAKLPNASETPSLSLLYQIRRSGCSLLGLAALLFSVNEFFDRGPASH
jgi:hypothetical protein